MSLLARKRILEDLVSDLLGPLLKGGGPEPGWKLIGWDAEQGICLTFARGRSVLLLELEGRDEGLDCYARTARFNVCARRQFQPERKLTAAERRLVDSVLRVIGSREDRLPEFERPSTSRRLLVREIEVERMLMPEGRGQYYLNPYSGCMIGCPYCYVQERADFSRSLEGLPRMPWGRWLDVKVNAAEVLRREVIRLRPGMVRMSPILTDPYQPVERKYRVTRDCLQVLLQAGFIPAVLTRSARILEDIDLLRRFPRALVGLSIPTDKDSYRLMFEPGADPIEERIEAVRKLAQAGLTTVALIQPVLPMDASRLAGMLSPHVRAVRIDRLYFSSRLEKTLGEEELRAAADEATGRRLMAQAASAFRRRGVETSPMDDMWSLLPRRPSARRRSQIGSSSPRPKRSA